VRPTGSDRPVAALDIEIEIGIETIVAAARPFIAAEFASSRANSRGPLDTLRSVVSAGALASPPGKTLLKAAADALVFAQPGSGPPFFLPAPKTSNDHL